MNPAEKAMYPVHKYVHKWDSIIVVICRVDPPFSQIMTYLHIAISPWEVLWLNYTLLLHQCLWQKKMHLIHLGLDCTSEVCKRGSFPVHFIPCEGPKPSHGKLVFIHLECIIYELQIDNTVQNNVVLNICIAVILSVCK